MKRKQADLDEEIRSHLEMATRDRIERGASASDAAAAARREFGNVAVVKEVTRAMWSWLWIERILQDLRYAARVLRRSRGFAAVAVLSLALGIGANTAIFQVINAVRLRPLPVPDPGALALISIVDMTGARGNFEGSYPPVTNPIWEQLRADQQAFSGVLAWSGATFNLTPGGVARRVRGVFVSGSFFQVLGIQPAAGHLFSPSDDVQGCPLRAVVSHGFWQRELGGRLQVSDAPLMLDGHAAEIVGVSEARFFGVEVGRGFDVAVPICSQPRFSSGNRLASGTDWWLTVMGRLKPGWTHHQASAHLTAISPGIFAATLPANYPAASVEQYRNFKLQARAGGGGASAMREDYGQSLWLLLGISSIVLVIACVNLANLMLARAAVRQREFAVRLGLGASRARVIRQLLVESLLLAAIGAASGALVARVLSRVFVASLDRANEFVFLDVPVDWRVLAFTAAAAVLTTLLFGLAPALRVSRAGTDSLLLHSGRSLAGSRERLVVRRVLVTVQVALSVLLVIGATLLTRTLTNLTRVNPGFATDDVLIAELDMRGMRTPPAARLAMHSDMLNRLRSIPGVQAAAEASVIPLSGDSWGNVVWMEGSDPTQGSDVLFNRVSADYFSALRIPLVAGRTFSEADTQAATPIAVVTEAFTRRFDRGHPIGQRFKVEPSPGRPEGRTYEIVGVVRDSSYLDLRQEAAPQAFLPSTQATSAGEFARVLVRSDLPTSSLTATIVHALRELHPGIVVSFTPLTTHVRETLLRERLLATLSIFFGAVAGLLAVVGLYGVIAYTVARRTKEIGVRLALGASPGDIFRTIMNEALLLLAGGIALGIPLALAGGQLARSLLFGVDPGDPVALAVAVGALGGVALLASYLPARSATRIAPTVALREE